MFIAPGLAALTSSTISEHSNKAGQLFYTDKDKIDNLTEEFNTFLSICEPLMHIFTGSNTYNFHKLQLEFEKQPGSLVSFSDMFSFETMPESLLKKLINRNTRDKNLKKAALSIYRERSKAFLSNITNNKYTEILNFSEIEKISFSKKLIKVNNFFSRLNLHYTPSDFNKHIKNIIYLLEKYDNYNIVLSKKKISGNFYMAAPLFYVF